MRMLRFEPASQRLAKETHMPGRLRALLTDKRVVLRLAMQVFFALALAMAGVWLVSHYVTPQLDAAAKVVAGVVSAAVALLTGAKTLVDLSKSTSEVHEVRQVLHETEKVVLSKEAEVRAKDLELASEKARDAKAKAERTARAEEISRAIAAKCNSAPKLSDIVWSKDLIAQIRWSDALAEKAERVAETAAVAPEYSVGAKLVVVASGKGGVGKSTLALGLTEAFSRRDRTLLVDFDLHNRGLTSLLHPSGDLKAWGQPFGLPTNVLSEMDRFHMLFDEARLLVPSSSRPLGQPEVDPLNRFVGLRDALGKAGTPMPYGMFRGEVYRPLDEQLPVIPERAGFLPSTSSAPNVRFLASAVFEAQFLEVYFFLKCLCYWAGNLPNQFATVVLDCHGAHDHFMIGAIHAASALLVVTTPEPGGFDGTYDLLAFAEVLRKETPTSGGNFPTVLAINNCLDWQEESVAAIASFVKEKAPLSFVTPVTIANENGIRSITNNYEFGDAARATTLWKAANEIHESFARYWETQASPRSGLEGSNGLGVTTSASN